MLQGKNDDVLKFARNAKPVTQLAPAAAPPGQEMATFAGVSTNLERKITASLFFYLFFPLKIRRAVSGELN